MYSEVGFQQKVAKAKKLCEARLSEEKDRLSLEGLLLLVAEVKGGGPREWGRVRFQKELLTAGGWRRLGKAPAKGNRRQAKKPLGEVLDAMTWHKPRTGLLSVSVCLSVCLSFCLPV